MSGAKGVAEGVLDEGMIDEIANEILREVSGKRDVSRVGDALEKRNLREMIRLKNRVDALEHRLEKFVKGFRIESVEAERHITSSSEEIKGEAEQFGQLVAGLQGQVEDLRAIVIRLNNQLKELKGEAGGDGEKLDLTSLISKIKGKF